MLEEIPRVFGNISRGITGETPKRIIVGTLREVPCWTHGGMSNGTPEETFSETWRGIPCRNPKRIKLPKIPQKLREELQEKC